MSLDLFSIHKLTTEKDIIESLIDNKHIVDFGVVVRINADKTIGVKHANGFVHAYTYPHDVHTVISDYIEVIYMGFPGITSNQVVQVGDPILLVGLRDYVPSTRGPMAASKLMAPPTDPGEYHHYSESTLKAIPLVNHTQAVLNLTILQALGAIFGMVFQTTNAGIAGDVL